MSVTITGSVNDWTGQPMAGVVVSENETGLTAATGANGAWSLTTPNTGGHSLSVLLGGVAVAGAQVSSANASVPVIISIGPFPLAGGKALNKGSQLAIQLARALGGAGEAESLLVAINAGLQAAGQLAAHDLTRFGELGSDNEWTGNNYFSGFCFSGWGNGVVPTAQQGTVTAIEFGIANFHQTVLTFTNTPLALSDNLGVTAYGGLGVYNLPPNSLLVFGAVANLAVTKSSSGVTATFRSTMSLGTATADNTATLTGTEANLIPSTANPQAVSGATTAKGRSTLTQAPAAFDGTTTTTSGNGLPVFLNFLVNQADETVGITPCNLILNGTIRISWTGLGDY